MPTVNRDHLSKAERSALMSRIKTKDTVPEKAVKAILVKYGIPFRAQARDLPGTPDFVLLETRLAIFVNGDFWHGRIPKKAFLKLTAAWRNKLEKNRSRDARARRRLWRLGWSILTIWESDLKDPTEVRNRLLRARRTA
jgi:DNA mismatch endonuclease (patch repair protein)